MDKKLSLTLHYYILCTYARIDVYINPPTLPYIIHSDMYTFSRPKSNDISIQGNRLHGGYNPF